MLEDPASRLQKLLSNRGLDVKAVPEPAEDETVDDEIAFETPDGSARYPAAVQMGPGYFCTVLYEFDAAGEVEAATHGVSYDTMVAIDSVAAELAALLRANPPRPKAAAPAPAP